MFLPPVSSLSVVTKLTVTLYLTLDGIHLHLSSCFAIYESRRLCSACFPTFTEMRGPVMGFDLMIVCLDCCSAFFVIGSQDRLEGSLRAVSRTLFGLHGMRTVPLPCLLALPQPRALRKLLGIKRLLLWTCNLKLYVFIVVREMLA